jgi:hypothetical protein
LENRLQEAEIEMNWVCTRMARNSSYSPDSGAAGLSPWKKFRTSTGFLQR